MSQDTIRLIQAALLGYLVFLVIWDVIHAAWTSLAWLAVSFAVGLILSAIIRRRMR